MNKSNSALAAVFLFLLAAAAVLGFPQKSQGVLGTNTVTQVGVVVRDVDKASRALAEILGVDKPQWFLTDTEDKAHTLFAGRPTGARAKLAFFSLKNLTIELIEPVGGPSTWQKFLDERGQGIHHIAFEITAMGEKTGFLGRHGLTLVQSGDYEGGRYAYIDGTEPLGLVLELLENFEDGKEAAAGPSGRSFAADTESVDAVMKAFYESLSFPAGKAPDLERYRNLFVSGTVPCHRTTPGAVLDTDVDGFIDNYTGRIRNGTLTSLDEREIARNTQSFGEIAQVFSAYRKALNGVPLEKAVRGINALQLIRQDGRWRIASIAWEDESPGRPVPPQYLK